jgi:hypothetical protein
MNAEIGRQLCNLDVKLFVTGVMPEAVGQE